MTRIGLLLCLCGLPLLAELVDRVAVSIDDRVITMSAIRRQLRLDAFVRRVPVDLSPSSLRAAASRLVNQALVEREMALIGSPMPDIPEVQKLIADLQASRQQNDAAFRSELTKYGFTPEDLQQDILWQLRLMRFVDFRFRPGVQVSEAEAREYYDKEFKQLTSEAQSFEDAREAIDRVLTNRKLNDALEQWLGQTRLLVRIRYREEVFE